MLLTEESFVLWLLEKKKQEILKKDAMIEWLAKQLDEHGECSPPDAPCHDGGPYCCPSASPIGCAKCWIKAAEKAVRND